MTAEGRQYGYFQQSNARSHNADRSVATTCEVFDNRIINRVLSCPRFPGLGHCDICHWANLKGKVYKYNPRQ